MSVHFVGFRGAEYHSAIRIWGKPDFVHIGWDRRAQEEIAEYDIVVFAKGEWTQPVSQYNYSDMKPNGPTLFA